MQLITHQSHLDALPASDLKFHLQARYNQLSEDTDVPPNIVVTEDSDQIDGPDFGFVGSNGSLSDLFEVHKPGHPDFARPYEWVRFIQQIETFELLVLTHGEDGVLILCVQSHSRGCVWRILIL
jgi:hypothetical protein